MLNLHNAAISFSGTYLFQGVSYKLSPGDRVGLIGKNGAGKSTMLKVLSKELELDEGTLACDRNISIGVLKQDESQDLLSELAAIPQISLIITVDHIGITRLWNDSQLDRFNFYSVQMDTFQSYGNESHYQPDLFAAKNDNQENGIAYILKSMTEN